MKNVIWKDEAGERPAKQMTDNEISEKFFPTMVTEWLELCVIGTFPEAYDQYHGVDAFRKFCVEQANIFAQSLGVDVTFKDVIGCYNGNSDLPWEWIAIFNEEAS